MFIVRNRSELFRFGLYLALVCAMVFFASAKMGRWLKASTPPATEKEAPVTTPVRATASASTEGDEMAAIDGAGMDFFASYRFDRERARSELKETLREVMASASASDAVRKEANERFMLLGRATELERKAEALLKAKGFADVIVELGDGHVQVIVRAPRLDKTQAAQITDLVARMAGVKASQVNIISR